MKNVLLFLVEINFAGRFLYVSLFLMSKINMILAFCKTIFVMTPEKKWGSLFEMGPHDFLKLSYYISSILLKNVSVLSALSIYGNVLFYKKRIRPTFER